MAKDRTTAVVPQTAATRASIETPTGLGVPPARAAACGLSVPSRTRTARDSALSRSAFLQAVPAPPWGRQPRRHVVGAVRMGTELLNGPLHVGTERSAELRVRREINIVCGRDEALDEAP